MRPFALLAALLLLPAALTAQPPTRSADWHDLAVHEGVALGIDTRVVRSRGDTTLVWIDFRHPAPVAGPDGPYIREITSFSVVCPGGPIRAQHHARSNELGDAVGRVGRVEETWRTPEPGSVRARIVEEVCARFLGFARPAAPSTTMD